MSCQSPPPPPDLTASAEASEEIARIQAATAADQLAWGKEQDAMNRDVLNRVLDIQLPAMEASAAAAIKDRERYETLFQPLEENLIREFQDYDSPERVLREKGKAIADVSATFDASRRNALQRLESYGVDPSQTRNAALDVNVRTQQAAAQAAAATAAGQRVEDVGRSLRAEAINIGKGLPSQVAGAYGTSLAAGQGSIQGATSTTAAGIGARTSGQGFTGQALQGYQQGANIRGDQFAMNMQNWQAGQDQTMGMVNAASGIAGMAIREGGPVRRYQDGGQAIPFQQDGPVDTGVGDGSGIDDAVPAQLSDGEYVIPADVVRKKGEEFFDKLVEKYHVPAEEQERQAREQQQQAGPGPGAQRQAPPPDAPPSGAPPQQAVAA